jgi:hypothetical protein
MNLFFRNFQENANLVLNAFYSVSKKIQLPILYEVNNFFEIEYKKCFARGFLRYHPSVAYLQKNILYSLYQKDLKSFAFTRFYPMIHLSQDVSEEGSYHYDQNDKNQGQTIWTAISDYNYNSLSIFNLNFIKKKKINNLFIRLKIPNLFSSYIKAKQGDVFLWKTTLIHKGNLNNSNQISVALQMQKTDFEAISDVHKLYTYKENYPAIDIINLNDGELEGYYINYSYLIENIKKILLSKLSLEKSLSELMIFLFKEHKREYSNKNKIFSFAFSVLAQRLLGLKNKKIGSLLFVLNCNIDHLVLLIDLCSIFFGCENFISYKRTFCTKKYSSDLIFIFKKFDRFKYAYKSGQIK